MWWRYSEIDTQCKDEYHLIGEGEDLRFESNWIQCMRVNGFDVPDPKQPEPPKSPTYFWKAEIPE